MEMGIVSPTHTSNDMLAKCLLYLHNVGLCWSRDLSFQGRSASTREYNFCFIELEVENDTFLPLAPHGSEQTMRFCYTGWSDWL